jgi:sec-independent protein translocase protein TatC
MRPERSDESRLTLAGHLEELRRRLAIALAAFLAATALSLSQAERLLGWLRRPAEGMLPSFAFFTPAEPLLAYVRVGVLAGVILAMPIILGQLWGFVRSGLTPRERALGAVFIWWGSAQCLAGAAFAYWVLAPASLRILLGIGRRILQPVISIDAYVSFVTALVGWCALVFELPVVLVVLARLGIVTPEWLRQQRPYALLVLVIIAAIITPTTDPLSLLLMAAPLALLYELSIVVTRLAWRRARDE